MSLFVCFYCLIGWVGGFTRIVAEGHGLSDCFFTRSVAESHGFFFLSRIVGFFSSHGESRRSRIFLVPNFRINTFNHTESRGRSRIIELSNFLHTENRGRSRIFLHTECWKCGGVGDEEGWGGCLFLYVTVKIMCISWVSQTSIRR